MALTQGMDDALIAVFDAKYAYNFWRPITAIRNGDADGSNATVATVIAAEVGTDPMPRLSTTSDVVKATRSWATPEELVREVALARIYDGVHYRYSTEVGSAMGRQVGALAAARHFDPP